MPKQGRNAAQAQQGESARRSPASSPPQGEARENTRDTGERDENYNLISVLYHALQGAETMGQYIADAADEDELRSFFEETRDEYAQRAALAKRLLAERLSEESEEDEEDEEDEEEDD
jgi:hypothetical protein